MKKDKRGTSEDKILNLEDGKFFAKKKMEIKKKTSQYHIQQCARCDNREIYIIPTITLTKSFNANAFWISAYWFGLEFAVVITWE